MTVFFPTLFSALTMYEKKMFKKKKKIENCVFVGGIKKQFPKLFVPKSCNQWLHESFLT